MYFSICAYYKHSLCILTMCCVGPIIWICFLLLDNLSALCAGLKPLLSGVSSTRQEMQCSESESPYLELDLNATQNECRELRTCNVRLLVRPKESSEGCILDLQALDSMLQWFMQGQGKARLSICLSPVDTTELSKSNDIDQIRPLKLERAA